MVMRTTQQVLSSYAAAVRQETTHRTDTHRSTSPRLAAKGRSPRGRRAYPGRDACQDCSVTVPPIPAGPLWHATDRDEVQLACAEFGGNGTPVVLLHGLAGCGEEWAETASALTPGYRVLAPDQRGHGRSERRPSDVSRGAYVVDVAMWLERLAAVPAVLVGQSLGGHTAFLVAARHPDLVRALVVVEATPEADPRGGDDVRRWLESWPRPFVSAMHALQFFGGDSAWSRAWLRGLDARDDGLWPRFDIDVMMASLSETSADSY